MGRPSTFTQEKADSICDIISTSNKSLRTIALELNIPVTTILQWLRDNIEFSNQYARAKEMQADFLAEEIIEISEHTEEDHTAFTGTNVVQRDKLRIEARKWVAAKLKPKKYGDRLDLTTDGEKLAPLDLSAIPTDILLQVLAQNNANDQSGDKSDIG